MGNAFHLMLGGSGWGCAVCMECTARQYASLSAVMSGQVLHVSGMQPTGEYLCTWWVRVGDTICRRGRALTPTTRSWDFPGYHLHFFFMAGRGVFYERGTWFWSRECMPTVWKNEVFMEMTMRLLWPLCRPNRTGTGKPWWCTARAACVQMCHP